jgi:hypothetical protein
MRILVECREQAPPVPSNASLEQAMPVPYNFECQNIHDFSESLINPKCRLNTARTRWNQKGLARREIPNYKPQITNNPQIATRKGSKFKTKTGCLAAPC